MKSFLYDKEYFISIFESNIHIYGFINIIKFSDAMAVFEFKNFNLNVKGEKLLVNKLLQNEVIISGNIKSLNIMNEKTNLD